MAGRLMLEQGGYLLTEDGGYLLLEGGRPRFIDRLQEQATLETAWRSGQPELILVHGRRRVGKSALLSRFAARRDVVYYVAAQQLEAAQLGDLGRVVGPLLTMSQRGRAPRLAFRDWDELLSTLSEAARTRRVGLVIDEFPYLIEANRALPSIIQRWWDQVGSRSNLVLVLAGSEQQMMKSLVDRDGALHGRPTHRLEITPLDYYYAGRFVTGWNPLDRIRAYAVAGGMPAYLELLDDRQPLRNELLRLAFSPDGRLFHEASELVAREFPDPRTYETVLRAIAGGYVTPNQIAQQAGLQGANRVTPYLAKLLQLGLVERRTPPGDARDVRPRISQYVLADPYLRFYFALLDPWRSPIQQGKGAAVLDSVWGDEFERFVSRTFEDVAVQYLLRLSGAGRLPVISSAGRWWFDDGDIDAAAFSGRRIVAAGEAKWTNEYFKPAEVEKLKRRLATVAPREQPDLFLFSKAGFDRNVRRQQGVTRVSPADLFRPRLEYERPLRRPRRSA